MGTSTKDLPSARGAELHLYASLFVCFFVAGIIQANSRPVNLLSLLLPI